MVTFYHEVNLVQGIFVIPASYSHKPKTNGTHCKKLGVVILKKIRNDLNRIYKKH